MAKKAAKKGVKRATRRAARVGVDFKRLHYEIDAALARLQGHKSSAKRTELMWKLRLMRAVKLCPKNGMFAELE
jgi:hypothetical protein